MLGMLVCTAKVCSISLPIHRECAEQACFSSRFAHRVLLRDSCSEIFCPAIIAQRLSLSIFSSQVFCPARWFTGDIFSSRVLLNEVFAQRLFRSAKQVVFLSELSFFCSVTLSRQDLLSKFYPASFARRFLLYRILLREIARANFAQRDCSASFAQRVYLSELCSQVAEQGVLLS